MTRNARACFGGLLLITALLAACQDPICREGWLRCAGHHRLDRYRCVDSHCIPLDTATLALGESHTCALRSGTVWCWGLNDRGQLGLGSEAELHSAPQRVTGIEDAVHLVAGSAHTCALTQNGAVWCWGQGSREGIGVDDDVVHRSPVLLEGLPRIAGLSAGHEHTCAWDEDGQLWCWGENLWGQLGVPFQDRFDAGSPSMEAIPGLSDVRSAAAGDSHTCVLHETGAVSCWGHSAYGQIGERSADALYWDPEPVHAIFDAVDLAAGDFHTCVVHVDGGLSCWGEGVDGQLGDGTYKGRATPARVPGITDAIAARARGDSVCALHANGRVSCWGDVGFDEDWRTSPKALPGIRDAANVALGASHACILRSGGDIECWGHNDTGQLGLGHTGIQPSSTGEKPLESPGGVVAIPEPVQGLPRFQ